MGPGEHAGLVEAAAVGAQWVRTRMADAVELVALVGAEAVDAAPGVAVARPPVRRGRPLAIVAHAAAGEGGADETRMILSVDPVEILLRRTSGR